MPVVVLVDRDTASSSEIVTGALQDRDRATVVGTRTFGKGVFQEIRELPNGGALDITVGQYFLPERAQPRRQRRRERATGSRPTCAPATTPTRRDATRRSTPRSRELAAESR